jgi:CheY-like chemotaxis protein
VIYTDSNIEVSKREHFGREGTEFKAPAILVVEDDHGLETVLKRAISRSEPLVNLTWVGTGSEALDKLEDVRSGRQQPYALILADLLLPNMELGTHVWRFSQRNMADTPFAMMSSVQSDAYLRMFLSGENPPPFLKKPFRVDEFIQFLKFYLSEPKPGHNGN